jgi:hypothetical protein
MRTRIWAVAASALVMTAMVFADTASAHTFTAKTSLDISKSPEGPTKPNEDVLVFGNLHSENAFCRKQMDVQVVKRKRNGRPGAVLGHDTTDGDGDWGVTLTPGATIRVFARFKGFHESSYEHDHTCLKSHSGNLRLVVG